MASGRHNTCLTERFELDLCSLLKQTGKKGVRTKRYTREREENKDKRRLLMQVLQHGNIHPFSKSHHSLIDARIHNRFLMVC